MAVLPVYKNKLSFQLTPIKEVIYKTIQKSAIPYSAYQLLEKIKNTIPNAKPMMVYRALISLEKNGLIHKIKSTSTYHYCKDVVHKGAVFFLICQKCGIVKELDMQAPILKEINRIAKNAGFSEANEICEIPTECNPCSSLK